MYRMCSIVDCSCLCWSLSLSHCTYWCRCRVTFISTLQPSTGKECLPAFAQFVVLLSRAERNLFHIQLQPPLPLPPPTYGNRKSIVLISWTTGGSYTCCTFNLDANIFCIHVRCIRRIPHSLDWGEKLWTWFASCSTAEKKQKGSIYGCTIPMTFSACCWQNSVGFHIKFCQSYSALQPLEK